MSHEFWRTFALYVITKEETKTFRVGALNLLVGPTLHAAAKTWYSCFRASWYNLVYKAESLFVCLFAPYTNSHFWTDLNQTLHISPPWSGRDRRVCMVRKCLNFSTILTLFVGSGCRILGTKWLLARVIRDSVISVILAGVSVTSRKWRCSRRQFRVLTESVMHYGKCIKTRRSEGNACV
jgi:hypothetical protein